MKHLILLVATYLALATQAACGTTLSIGDCRPPLMWLPVVLALTWFGDGRGIAWAALVGVLTDGLTSSRFGMEMLSATLTAALMLSLRPDDETRSRGVWLVWQCIVLVSGLASSRGLNGLVSDTSSLTFDAFVTLLGEAIYGSGLCLFFGVLGIRRSKNLARFHHA